MNTFCQETMEIAVPGTGGYGYLELGCELPAGHEQAHKDRVAGIYWYPVRP